MKIKNFILYNKKKIKINKICIKCNFCNILCPKKKIKNLFFKKYCNICLFCKINCPIGILN